MLRYPVANGQFTVRCFLFLYSTSSRYKAACQKKCCNTNSFSAGMGVILSIFSHIQFLSIYYCFITCVSVTLFSQLKQRAYPIRVNIKTVQKKSHVKNFYRNFFHNHLSFLTDLPINLSTKLLIQIIHFIYFHVYNYLLL